MTPRSGIPWRARPRSRTPSIPGWAARSTLLTMAPATDTPCFSKSAAFRTISSIGRPTPPSLTITAGAPNRRATTAFESPITAPTPAWPVPSMSTSSFESARIACARRILAPRSSTTSPAMYAFVKPRGMCTGLMTSFGSVRPKTAFMSTASSSAGTPLSSVTVRWPTGFVKPVRRPSSTKAWTRPSEAVVFPRFWPVAARYRWRIRRLRGATATAASARSRTGSRESRARSARTRRGARRRGAGSAGPHPATAVAACRIAVGVGAATRAGRGDGSSARGGLPLDERDRLLEARDRLGLDRVRLEVRAEPLQHVADEAQEDAGVRHEELRLVVVANQRQATLEDAAVLDVGDLGGERVALDSVRVVQEVEGVVDRQAEARPPGDEPFVHLGRDPDLGHLVEHLGRHGEQADERAPGARAEHDLERPLQREDLRIEARAGDDVGEEILDVVEHRGVRHRGPQVADLLLEQELLFVVEHPSMVHRGMAGTVGPRGDVRRRLRRVRRSGQ